MSSLIDDERVAIVLREATSLIDRHPAGARRAIVQAGPVDRNHPQFVALRQLYARSIYKDEDLLAPRKYEDAVAVLESDCDLATSRDGETLGLAGAAYKRLWDHTGQRTHLERALKYYRQGYECAADADGWLGVNTAYVLDLLGVQERDGAGADAQARARRRFADADTVRNELLTKLTTPPAGKNPWFFHATRAEALFALSRFDEASAALEKGLTDALAWRAQYEPDSNRPLRRETTARQLSAIARLRFQGADYLPASAVVQKAFGMSERAVRSLFAGKIGLALSGGGFRASLFHIGVLAKLAELDLLRDVEVLSCVSGGSIVGAFYYLELKKRLESGNTTHADYLAIVRDVERKFRAGVQKNIRTRIAASPWAGLKMAFQSGYSRTDRAGELYQEHLYDLTADPGTKAPRLMAELKVQPAAFDGEQGQSFNPKYDNWHLDAKVPMLVLNATSLNTGHNWQFTATWMGESPQAISDTIDSIPRYRRMYYETEAPKPHDAVSIGTAVGASACVPALFEPIVMRSLFPERTVRLVDGGVHDNQGLSSLLEQNCRIILISDASGQMKEITNPGGSIRDSFGGSNEILQARVREAQFDQLSTLRRAGAIQGSMFIHLTKDVESGLLSWIGAEDHKDSEVDAKERTSYGVDTEIQTMLSAVRTDLDSFSDAEAFALMTSGYRMAEHALLEENCTPTLSIAGDRQPWTFLAAENALTAPGTEDNRRMRALLTASNELSGKVWRQVPALRKAAVPLGLAVAAGLIAVVTSNASRELPNVGKTALIAGAIAAVAGLFAFLDRKQVYHKRPGEIALGLGVATLGSIAAWTHLKLFDPLFLRHGSWPPVRPAQPQPQPPVTPPTNDVLHVVDPPAPAPRTPPASMLPPQPEPGVKAKEH